MRLGVLDVGSNTIHLLVVDAYPGAAPVAAASVKTPLRLSQLLSDDGSLGPEGARKLADTLDEARREAEKLGAEELMAFATSAVRDATNAAEVLADVRQTTGVDLEVLPGEDEARLTFLAVRRWFGWSAGRLLALDIGGGSLEVACGQDEDPDVAASLPLGASRLTRDWLRRGPAEALGGGSAAEVREGADGGAGAAALRARRARPRRRDEQDVPLARPHRGGGAVQQGPVRPARSHRR